MPRPAGAAAATDLGGLIPRFSQGMVLWVGGGAKVVVVVTLKGVLALPRIYRFRVIINEFILFFS